MDVLHEVVEVNAGLGGLVGWKGIVEEIHQHGLAGTHISVHVEALGQIFRDLIDDLLFLGGAEEGAKDGFLGRL